MSTVEDIVAGETILLQIIQLVVGALGPDKVHQLVDDEAQKIANAAADAAAAAKFGPQP